MRVIVCGGRDYTNAEHVYREMDRLHKRLMIDVVIEGDAQGVDRMAGYWARKNKIDNRKFRADWKRLGRAAGPLRNRQMLEIGQPHCVIAFPGGPGTANMIKQARDAGVEVIEIGEARQ